MAFRQAPILFVALTIGSLAGCGGDEATDTAGVSDTTLAVETTAAAAATPADIAAETPATVDTAATAATAGGEVPHAIVSLSAAATEILYAIGAGGQVVATDLASNYPPEAEATEKLDGFNPSVEAIAATSPDLVIVFFDPGGVIDALEALDIPVLDQPAPPDLPGVYTQIGELGAATGHPEEAAQLVELMSDEIAGIVDPTPPRPEPASYYHELDPSFFSVTSNTFLGSVYGLLPLENIADAANAGDYPQLSQEFIVSADPDLIFLADVKCCAQTAAAVAARPGWETMTAVSEGRVIELDDDVASRPGPRIPQLLAQAAAAVELVP